MTSFENPKAIRHFQSICDSCQDLVLDFIRHLILNYLVMVISKH